MMAFKSIPCPLCGDKLPLKLNQDGDLQAVCRCSGSSTVVAVVCKPEEKFQSKKGDGESSDEKES